MAAVKLAFTSDLHLPMTPPTVIAQLAQEIAASEPDVLAVAGDIGEGLAAIEECLRILTAAVLCPVVAVAGNHDLWLHEPPRLTRERWSTHLPETVRKAGAIWLEGEAFVVKGIALVGTIAWYDYSAADTSIREPLESFARNKRHYNPDAYLIEWSYSDPGFAALVAEPFLRTLDRLEGDATVRQTVVFTHVPLLECQMCRKPENRDWSFSNAYFGNLTLGAEVIQRRKVTHIVSGHTHVPRHALAKLTDGRIVDARVLNSQYGRPAWEMITLDGTD
jgi:hypothetical protein